MDERHQRRIAANESRFRAMNQRITRELDAFEVPSSYSVMCECALDECDDMIHIDRPTYREIREDARRFVVLPEHVLEGAERTIDAPDDYWIIEKIEAAGERAEDLYHAP